MDARERWQALQARLTAARAAVDAGDRETALAEIGAALDLDKDFLAAQALRDRIMTLGADPAPPTAAPAAIRPRPAVAAGAPVQSDGYAKFEQRAKRRRVDRRIDAARAAIEQQRLKAAAAALDEVIELDPNLPELVELTARFDELRRAATTPHRGPWIAAAAVFASALLGGTWLQDATPILSRQIVSAAPLQASLTPMLMIGDPAGATGDRPIEIGTTGIREPFIVRAPEPEPALVPAVVPVSAPVQIAAVQPRVPDAASLSSAASRLPTVPLDAPPSRAPEPASAITTAAAIVPAATPISRPDTRDEEGLIKQVLQRYRTAYEGLDAQSAQVVWPAVNEAALARAFDGLESQSLTFDACDVRLRGEAAATAICHGSARYVPKVGSRDPRTESRVWNFTLRKAGTDWKIDSARADR